MPGQRSRTPAKKRIRFAAELQRLLTRVTVTLSVVILVLIALLISIHFRYSSILLNADTAADFNTAFKTTIDSDMYSHVIQPRSDHDAEDLPIRELDEAVSVLHRLEATTTLPDNKWRLQSMLVMCENLRGYMLEIANEPSYDKRMSLLDRNIRGETGLTLLIENYMHAYIDEEVRELARVQKELSQQLVFVVVSAVLFTLLILIGTLMRAIRISGKVIAPIEALAAKARHIGSGDFLQAPVQTDFQELQELDHGFDEMSRHISTLIETQRRDQEYLRRAELELLQAQINPHFLYNTLDSIAILAEMEREEDVVTMVTMLSTLFRTSLSNGQQIIMLEEELRHVTSYLEIQHIRYSDIMQYTIEVPEEMKKLAVPKLILQPLVENALYHGIKNKRGLGQIVISGHLQNGLIILQIRDNGAGMDPEKLEALRNGLYENKHTGLGLMNVHKRIGLYCGEQYGLSFDSVLHEGTTVTVTLPSDLTLPHEGGAES